MTNGEQIKRWQSKIDKLYRDKPYISKREYNHRLAEILQQVMEKYGTRLP